MVSPCCNTEPANTSAWAASLLLLALLVYHSGETFFTLGYGDIIPSSGVARALAVIEAGLGFAFSGRRHWLFADDLFVILPSRDRNFLARCPGGSPPSAAELLSRFGNCPQQAVLDQIFKDWERWAAEVLESHLSYPVLSFFRSQHNNQSWLGALITILDASALVIAGVDGLRYEQAKITFAMARHAVVDLAQVVNARYAPDADDRLPAAGTEPAARKPGSARSKAARGRCIRGETDPAPFVVRTLCRGHCANLSITLPPWIHPEKQKDNWQAGPWDRAIQARSLAGRVQYDG